MYLRLVNIIYHLYSNPKIVRELQGRVFIGIAVEDSNLERERTTLMVISSAKLK